jgi:hypothetical protein
MLAPVVRAARKRRRDERQRPRVRPGRTGQTDQGPGHRPRDAKPPRIQAKKSGAGTDGSSQAPARRRRRRRRPDSTPAPPRTA